MKTLMTAQMHHLQQLESPDSTYWHASPPLVLSRAKGSIVEDTEGEVYIDLCCGFGSLPLGHNHVSFLETLKLWQPQDGLPPIAHGLGDVYPSLAKIDLAATLMAQAPPHLQKVSFSLSGSQAVETALKTAMLATGRQGFIAFVGGYHGVDLGTLPITSRQDFRAPFLKALPGYAVTWLPFGCTPEAIAMAIAHLKASPAGFAGFIVEPVQGRAGVIPAPEGWLASLACAAKESGSLLIFDEVFAGLGRSGCWSHSETIAADIILLGKALGGGMPISACLGTTAVMDAWPANRGEALHTGTFFGHPLSASVAKATLDEIQQQQLILRSQRMGVEALEALTAALDPVSTGIQVRGAGLFIGIQLPRRGMGAELMHTLRRQKIIALACGPHGEGLSLSPALNIDEGLWQDALKAICQAALASVRA
jgi:4-aminobutyrate aminotransferase-like enzyme